MPEISRFYGIVIYLFFNDHAPPHIHVEYSGRRAVVTIKHGEIKGDLPPRAKKMILEWLQLNRNKLLEDWELATKGLPLKRIEPLE